MHFLTSKPFMVSLHPCSTCLLKTNSYVVLRVFFFFTVCQIHSGFHRKNMISYRLTSCVDDSLSGLTVVVSYPIDPPSPQHFSNKGQKRGFRAIQRTARRKETRVLHSGSGYGLGFGTHFLHRHAFSIDIVFSPSNTIDTLSQRPRSRHQHAFSINTLSPSTLSPHAL